jgi:orotidine-5'-phosphate decarboxylase
MTLHDVRRELIKDSRLSRCAREVEEKNPIIVALDGKSWEEILPIVDPLRTTGCTWKVNDLLFNEGIRHLLPELSVYGKVMVDIKGHEIPNTVENTCKHLNAMDALDDFFVTVHASGGSAMVKAARQTLHAGVLLAVTVLTSIDPKTCKEIYHRRPLGQVKKLASIAWEGHADGFVCAPQEVKALRAMFPEAVLVTPGVRSPGQETHDQRRVDTPANAIANGANYVVMGRQILGAQDPVAEVRRVLRDELNVAVEN